MWEKIVLNLLSNAFKYTFNGEICVTLRRTESEASLVISDTGIGIPDTDKARVFDRFHRIRAARSRSYEGTGIGLALVQELVKLHGGQITVESAEGVGSRFTVTLPAGKRHLPRDRVDTETSSGTTTSGSRLYIEEALRWLPDDPEMASVGLRRPAPATNPAARARVLIADDSIDMRSYLVRLLGREYEVIAVEDGLKALELATVSPPDVVLTDVMMPVLDGFRLLNELRTHPLTKTIPVILLSARASEESRVEGLRLGADDYLVKPFAARELLARVGAHIELSRLRRSIHEELRSARDELDMRVRERTRELAATNEALRHEIVERRRVELALRASEQRLSAIFAQASVGLSEISPDGRFHRVNDALCQMLGRAREVLLASNVRDVTHPDDLERTDKAVSELMRTGQPQAFEKRHPRPDGGVVWVSAMISLVHDVLSQPPTILVVTVDLTARREAELALRESEARLRRAIEIETVGILFFNTKGEITGANDAFLAMSGYSRADLENGLVRRDHMTPPEWMSASLKALEEFKVTGRTVPYEKEYIRKDSTRWWALFAATRISANEGVEYVVDISVRKSAEEKIQKAREELELRVQERTGELDRINQTLRAEIRERQRAEAERQAVLIQLVNAQEEERRRISRELHDQVGQYLTALILGLKSLESGNISVSRATSLKTVQAIAETVGREIHDLALELRPTALDDLGLIRTLANYVEEWSQRSRVEVEFHTTGLKTNRLPSFIETTLYRIIREALNNVLKHAKAKRVSLILQAKGNQVIAIIEDDGQGFDLEAMGSPENRRRLGLASMKERAAMVNGELGIESNPGRGTTIFVRIPLPPKK
jgi:PAS domain S-box-containing protein